MKSESLKLQHFDAIKPHFVFWTVLIAYELAVTYSVRNKFAEPIDYFAFYVLNIALFYAHAEIVLRSFQNEKIAYGRVIIFSALEVVFYLIIKFAISALFTVAHLHRGAVPILFSITFIRDTTWRCIYFMGFSTAYAYILLTLKSQKRINDLDKQALQSQLEQQNLQQDLLASENAFLKAQINPHFLFNMLAFLHNGVYKFSEKLADQVISLSDLMRYAISEPESDGKVSLHGEIEHIENYMSLNKARFNDNLNLEFDYDGDLDGVRIIPLVMITVVENIFKYGELSDPQNPAIIFLNVADSWLHLHIANKKVNRPHVYSSGIGMVNIKKRLDLTYPGNNRIEVWQDEHNYRLDIFINISEK